MTPAPAPGGRGLSAGSAAAASAIALAASFLLVEVYELDVFWNVAIGRDILATRSVPVVDRYTTAGMGHPYFDIHWLFQVVAALSHAVAGWGGVSLLAAGGWGVALFLTWRSTRAHVPPALAAPLLALALLASAERILPRPEMATVLGLAFFWNRLQEGKFERGRDVALLVLVEALWANAHGLFVLGPFLALSVAAGEGVARLRGRPDRLAASLRLAALLVAATGLTPRLYATWSYAWLLVTQVGPSRPELFARLGELSPTLGAAFRASPAFWAWAALSLLALAGAAAAAVNATGLRRDLAQGPLLARLLAGGALLAISMSGRRNVVLFALAGAPLAAELWSIALPRLRELGDRLVPRVLAPIPLLALAAWPLSGSYYLRMEIPARFGLGVTPSFFPHALPAFLDRIGFAGNVYNSNTIGGFYLFHGWPRRLPLTEGRWTAYDDEVAARILSAPSDPAAFRRVVSDYGVTALVLAHSSPEAQSLLPRLPSDPAWRLAWYDHAASLWLKGASWPGVPAIELSRSSLPPPRRPEDGILLDLFFRAVGDAALAPRIENLERTSAFGWRSGPMRVELARLLDRAGRGAEAERTLRAVLSDSPGNAAAAAELAFHSWRSGDREEAARLLRRAIDLEPREESYRANLRLVEASGLPSGAPAAPAAPTTPTAPASPAAPRR